MAEMQMDSILMTECPTIASTVLPKKEKPKKQTAKKEKALSDKKTTSKPKKVKEVVVVDTNVVPSSQAEDSKEIPCGPTDTETSTTENVSCEQNPTTTVEPSKKPRRSYKRKALLKAELAKRIADMERRMDATIYCLDHASNVVRELLLRYSHIDDTYLIEKLMNLTAQLSSADDILNSPLEDEMTIVYHAEAENASPSAK
jgi:hypothetical protein